MTTRIESQGPNPGVASLPTAARVTPAPARPFRNVLSASANVVVSRAESAVRSLPGGPVLAAAVRTTPTIPAGSSPEGSAGTAGLVPTPSPGVDETAIEGSLDASADRNLYYLELQERISAESREYSTLSNVLKARHDTMKNAICNLR